MAENDHVIWRAWQLHLASAAHSTHDRVLSEVIAPVVRELPENPWFFIRYWQGGPHLRLRLGNLSEQQTQQVADNLRERLDVAGQLRADEEPLAVAQYSSNVGKFAAAELGADSVVEPVRAPGVYPAHYEPETQRYGGQRHLDQSEKLFQLSSDLVLQALPRFTASTDRSWWALRATVSAAVALGEHPTGAPFYRESLIAWRAWAVQTGNSAEHIQTLCDIVSEPAANLKELLLNTVTETPWSDWHRELARLSQALREDGVPAGRVLFSHVHMLNNRVGRGILQELRNYAWLVQAYPVPTENKKLPAQTTAHARG